MSFAVKGGTRARGPQHRESSDGTEEMTVGAQLWKKDDNDMTMTMTHSEKSRINQMRAWPYRQECRDHGPSKKNLSYWGSLLLGKVCKYKLLWTECNASWLEMNSSIRKKQHEVAQAVAALNSQ